MTPMEKFSAAVGAFAPATSAPWTATEKSRLREVAHPSRSVILSSRLVATSLFFIADGVAASEQTDEDGASRIARFFEAGQLCTNLTSIWAQEVANDTLVAITNVAGVEIPVDLFRVAYGSDTPLGRYFRQHVLETLVFDKDVICAKTSNALERRYRFVEERHARVLAAIPQKDVARFLGVTPQGLSRFLKNRQAR